MIFFIDIHFLRTILSSNLCFTVLIITNYYLVKKKLYLIYLGRRSQKQYKKNDTKNTIDNFGRFLSSNIEGWREQKQG